MAVVVAAVCAPLSVGVFTGPFVHDRENSSFRCATFVDNVDAAVQ